MVTILDQEVLDHWWKPSPFMGLGCPFMSILGWQKSVIGLIAGDPGSNQLLFPAM